MNKDIFIKESPKENNGDDEKKLTEEEALEEIFRNELMLNIVG